MKFVRLLTEHISQWLPIRCGSPSKRQFHYNLRRVVRRVRRYGKVARRSNHWRYFLQLHPQDWIKALLHPQPPQRKRSPVSSHRPLALLLAIVCLSSGIGYRFYNEPQLAVNTIAPQTLRAPSSERVEDSKTTQENREAARTGSNPVLMVDQAVNQEIYQALQRLLDEANLLRQQAGRFPFVETSVLSTLTQQYLREATEADWQEAIAAAQSDETAWSDPAPGSTTSRNAKQADSEGASQQLAIVELQQYWQIASREDFAVLKQVIVRARQRYGTTTARLLQTANEPGSFYDQRLLNLTDSEWANAQDAIRRTLERMLTQGIAPGLPNDLLESAIRVQISGEMVSGSSSIAIPILIKVIQPNLIQDIEKTQIQAEQAAQAVKPTIVEIRRGEVIVHEGETISQADFVLLDYFNLSRRGINWSGLAEFTLLISGAVVVFLMVEQRFHPTLRQQDYLLILLLTLTSPMVIAMDVPTTTLPLVGLLVGSFYGSALGLTVVGLSAVALAVGLEITWSQLIASAIAGLLGAALAKRLRSREELAMLGGAVGITQGVIYLLLSLMLNTPANPVWYGVLTAATIQGLLGVACSVIALGLSPYLENLFDLITPIRLAELSNPNCPLLKRLASEAPGTFQHTLFVATLAEAAARALGCNVELVRAGTLYHDIGKMHDPMGFIENQMGLPNKHDTINDPWKSCAIIKKHVSEGLVMARKYRLPTAIQAFIPEHQGTMLIAYFYHEAQQRAMATTSLMVQEAMFRYDGPVPQSRETGIVMLADSCEAALRSLKDVTPEEALTMINRILRARWQDNQLVDAGLTRPELTRIAQIFVRVWQQFNHQRIAYPKLTPASEPSTVPQ